jgi:hypothetical protein
VARVSEQRERAREEAGGQLHGGEPEHQRERDAERPPVGAGVVVAVHRAQR